VEENVQNERLEADKKAKDGKQKERLKREAEEEEEWRRSLLQEAEEMKAARKKKEYFVRVLAEDARSVAPGDTTRAKDVADDGRFGPPPDGFVWSVLF
jgi:hypothetical protein